MSILRQQHIIHDSTAMVFCLEVRVWKANKDLLQLSANEEVGQISHAVSAIAGSVLELSAIIFSSKCFYS